MTSSLLRNLLFCCLLVILINAVPCYCQKGQVKKQAEDKDDVSETSDDSLDIAAEPVTNIKPCRRTNSTMKEVTDSLPKEFPFMVALLTHEKEFICSGAVIENGLILTAAHCIRHPLTYVKLNSTRVWNNKDEEGVYVNVYGREAFPTHSSTNTGESSKDVGLVMTEKFNKSVASMIPLMSYDSSENIGDFAALGFGLNAPMGSPKLLQQVVLNHRSMYDVDGETFKGFIDCIDTKVDTCFKDTGGPAIFNEQLIGIIVKGQEECTKEISSEYAINKYMVNVLPTYMFRKWVDERIKTHKKTEAEDIPIHPVKPMSREEAKKMKEKKKLLRRTHGHSSRLYDTKMAFVMTAIPCIVTLTVAVH